MNWVTCTLTSTNQRKAFNLGLIKAIEERPTAGDSVLEFLDGTKVVVNGGINQILGTQAQISSDKDWGEYAEYVRSQAGS